MTDDPKETAEAEETDESPEASEQTEDAPQKKEKKQKKVVRRRKSKKEKERPLTGAVRLAVESGKVEFGARSGMAPGSKAKLFVLAANAPKEVREKISSQARASQTPVIEFEGTSMELGSVCGCPFPVSVLSVYEEGSSNIMELAKKK